MTSDEEGSGRPSEAESGGRPRPAIHEVLILVDDRLAGEVTVDGRATGRFYGRLQLLQLLAEVLPRPSADEAG